MKYADLIRDLRDFADAMDKDRARIGATLPPQLMREAATELEREEAENERLRSVLVAVAENAEKRGLLGFGGIRQMLGEKP